MSKTTIVYRDIPPGATDDSTITSADATPFSDPQSLVEENYTPAAITGELNEWILDGTPQIVTSVPWWSKQISGTDCLFSDPPQIEIEFGEQYTSKGICLAFSENATAYADNVNIKWYQQDILKSDKDFTPDSYFYFCENAVESFDKIVITLLSTTMPRKYAKLDYIVFGVTWTFDMTSIRNARITEQIDLISNTVSIGELQWELENKDNIDFIFQFKQPMQVMNDGRNVGVYYIDEHERLSRLRYRLMCHNAFGILDSETFPDGVYNAYSAKTLLSDIVGNDFEIVYDGNIEDKQLTGILKDCTKRAAIQQVLFAWGICASCEAGYIRVFVPSTTAKTIDKNYVYTGMSISTSAIVTEVQLTAHQYTQDLTGSIEIGDTKYTDTQTVYTVKNPDVTANTKQNVKTFTSATLVSPDIAQALAQHIYDYYTRRDTAAGKIVWNGEKLGDCVTIPNAWDESSTGNIQRLEYTISNTIAANTEVLA